MNDVLISAIHFAFDLGVKATAIFLVTGAALLLLHRASAATRHFVGVLGLASALVLPVLSLALPRVAVPLLPDPRPQVHEGSVANDGVVADEPEAAPQISRRMLALSVPEKPVLAAETDVLDTPPSPAAESTPVPWFAIGLGLWAAGSLAIGARLAVGWARVRRIARQASPIRDADWLEERDRAARRLALDRRVDLMESEEVPVAMTSGMRRPLLFIGKVARLWEVERRRIVLLHELAHVRRGDWIALILAELAVALYWFHPVAWWLGRRVRRDAETACDDLVISSGTKPSVYAGHLLGIFRSLGSPSHPVAPALAIARPHHFEERLRAILDPRSAREEKSRSRATFYAAGLLTAAVAVAVVEPWTPRLEAFAAEPAAASVAAISSDENEEASSSVDSAASPSPQSCAGETVPVTASAKDSEQPDESASPSPSPSEDPEPAGSVPAIWTAEPGSTPEPAAGLMTASNKHRSPRDRDDWYGRGMELHHDENYKEAIAAFAKSIELGRKEAAASYNIACGYALLGEPDRAFEWLKRAMDAGFDLSHYIDHDDDLDSLKSDPRWAEWRRLARQSESKSEERKAQAVVTRYERIVAKNPSGGEQFFDVAGDLLRTDRYDLAAKAYQTAIDRGYRPATALYNQACAFALAGDANSAFDRLQRALDAGFDSPDHMRKDDDLDSLHGDPRFAALLKEAKALSLDGSHGWWDKESRSKRAEWREKAARYEAYANKHPQKGRAWFNLGYASLAADRPEPAAEAFRKALDLGYRKPTTMYNLACTYSRLDQVDTAFDWLFKALDAGFDSKWTLRADEDLDNLRGDPRYRKALQIARAKDHDDHGDED
jgi:beta-lactamase regulating signal transducer with metallopeptidase domain/Flp pilus assembly protein TadD